MAANALDPYATLGIPAGATQVEAARAHRRLAKRYHPDVNPGPEAAERMRAVNEAWRILSNPVRRAGYDAERAGRTTTASWAGPGYNSQTRTATWTTWPDDRRTAAPRPRRPLRPEPAQPSFGDRPAVLLVVWAFLGVLYVVGAWLGNLTP